MCCALYVVGIDMDSIVESHLFKTYMKHKILTSNGFYPKFHIGKNRSLKWWGRELGVRDIRRM